MRIIANKYFLAAFTTSLFLSCSNEQVQENTIPIIEKTFYSSAEKHVAVLNISGMTCQMGCAKSIEEKLANLQGVKAADVDFENEIANIEYDKSIVSINDLIASVHTLKGGKYEVNSAEMQSFVVSTDDTKQSGDKNRKMAQEEIQQSSGISFPNIFEIFGNIFRSY